MSAPQFMALWILVWWWMKAHNDKTFRSDGILKEVQVLNLASLSHAIIQVVVSQRCNFGRTELYQFLCVCVRTLICVEFFLHPDDFVRGRCRGGGVAIEGCSPFLPSTESHSYDAPLVYWCLLNSHAVYNTEKDGTGAERSSKIVLIMT